MCKDAYLPYTLKKELYNQCVLIAMAYAYETLTLTKTLELWLAAVQRNMERAMIGVSLQSNEWGRSKYSAQYLKIALGT